jgi:hypothetical protein
MATNKSPGKEETGAKFHMSYEVSGAPRPSIQAECSAGVNKRAAEAAQVGLYRASWHDTLL